jgi:uncharacterized protein YgbK (DUF1537 family)
MGATLKLSELLAGEPPARHIHDARRQVRAALVKSGKCVVVIDDDPTGMQTVQDVSVIMDWSVAALRRALAEPSPVFFVSVNSRSLPPSEARGRALEVGQNLRAAAAAEESEVLLASRSDSTLRGHFPYEVESLVSGLGARPDGIIFAPAFLEAGRYTVNDVHWAEQRGQLVPVSETEFARDPMFSFRNSNLKAWVQEKTHAAINADDVMSISLSDIREGGPDRVARLLLGAAGQTVIVVNAAEYADLDVVSLAVQAAEDRGKKFVYRCSASFVKSRGGFEDRALLTHDELVSDGGPGLIVVGSYVEKTSGQLRQLLDGNLAEGVELNIDAVLDATEGQREVARAARLIEQRLAAGVTTVLYTSRQLRAAPDGDFAGTGKLIMRALSDVVTRVKVRPAFMVAKGGTTSIEMAKTALGVKKALALGQLLPGVPVWRLGGESRWPGITYVVFPGNVGDDSALRKAVDTLRGI